MAGEVGSDGDSSPQVAIQVRFRVNFFTEMGQSVFVVGSVPELGEWDVKRSVPMKRIEGPGAGDFLWECCVDVTASTTRGAVFEYRYLAQAPEGAQPTSWEKRSSRRAVLAASNVFLGRAEFDDRFESARFRVQRELAFGENLYLLIENRDLGGWDVKSAAMLQWTDGHVWELEAELRSSSIEQPFKYKLAVCGEPYKELPAGRQCLLWEVAELRKASWGEEWVARQKQREVNDGAASAFRDAIQAVYAQQQRTRELEGKCQQLEREVGSLKGQIVSTAPSGRLTAFGGYMSSMRQLLPSFQNVQLFQRLTTWKRSTRSS